MRPEQLAKELNIDGKRLRAYLRKEFTRPAEARNTAWNLTPDQVKAAKAQFAPKG